MNVKISGFITLHTSLSKHPHRRLPFAADIGATMKENQKHELYF